MTITNKKFATLMTVDLYSVNFSDLKTLTRVFDNGSFTLTSEEFGVNQSAISYTIEKLRKHFGDPLFVRIGGGISATERCAEIVATARELLSEYDSIALPRTFDPATVHAEVTIACNYLERLLVLPGLIRSIRQRAPGVKIEIITSTSEGDIRLKQGSASLLIGPLVPDKTGFYSRMLFEAHYACVMDRENPLSKRDFTMHDYLACNHALVTYGGAWKSPYLMELESVGHRLRNVLSVPSPAGVEELLSGTDLVATLPSSIAARLGSRLREVPSPVPAPFSIHLVWTERTHNSALYSWLRQVIVTSVKPVNALTDTV